MEKCSKRKRSDPSSALQTVFRIKGGQPRKRTITSLSDLQKVVPNARRSHTKSRTGCQNCKNRRVKCDETRRGGCLRCHDYGIECDYLSTNLPDIGISTANGTPLASTALIVPNASSAARSLDNAGAAVLYSSLTHPTPLRYDLPEGITPYWQTLHHFERFTYPTITSIDGQRVFQTSVLAVAQSSDYLMHAMLGTAAAHLAWQANMDDLPREYAKYQRTEAYHWHRAIKIYRKRFESVGERRAEHVDALISTCMLLGIHLYLESEENDLTSFVWRPYEQRSEALRWLSLQSGFALLLRSLDRRAASSAWLDVISSAGPSMVEFDDIFTGANGEYRDFLDICDINEQSSGDNNPYFTVIQDLFALLQMGRPNMVSFARLMAFMGRLAGPFQSLLLNLDGPAMLVVAYWLVLMHQLQLWWIEDRARRECTAIVTFLQYDRDPRIRRLLQLPANAMNIKFPEA